MPIPLLLPAAVAASTQFSLMTLLTSTAAALTGGFVLGSSMSTSELPLSTPEESSLRSFWNELKAFPEQSTLIFKDAFRDFGVVSERVAHETKQLTRLTIQLQDALESSKERAAQVHKNIQEPLAKVDASLKKTHTKTETVSSLLSTSQNELNLANDKIKQLALALEAQKTTMSTLSTTVTPLTKALAQQKKDNENLKAQLTHLNKTHKTQVDGLKQNVQQQLEMNKKLETRLLELEQEVERLEKHNQSIMSQKSPLEDLLMQFKGQQSSLLKRIADLENDYSAVQKQNEQLIAHVSTEKEGTALLGQLTTLKLDRQRLQDALDLQTKACTQLEASIKKLEGQVLVQEETIVRLQSEQTQNKKQYNEVCALVRQLKQEAEEQEALIEQQAALISSFTQKPPIVHAPNIRFFPQKDAAIQSAVGHAARVSL